MKVILDEGVPKKIAPYLEGHEITTVQAMGWASVKNGKLLDLIEADGFDGFITCDKNLEFQQARLARRPFAVLLLSTNHLPTLLPGIGKITEALDTCTHGSVTRVDCGTFVPRRMRRTGRPGLT